MTTPSLTQRPIDIPPDAWERASWYARLRFVNARAKAERPIDRTQLTYHCTADIYVERVEELLEDGWTTLADVAREMNRTPGTVRRRLSIAGRRDLIERLRDAR